MRGRVFKQRAAAQKGGRRRCYLDNTAIAVNLLPAVAGNLASTFQHLINGLGKATFIRGIRATGMESAPGRGIGRIR